jgi:hypothetical protein
MADSNITATAALHIKLALEKIAAKQHAIQTYENYYDGKHALNFASEKFTTQFARRLQSFRDNLCKTAVKAPADRLEVIGFAANKNSEIYNKSWETWKYSKMPRIAKRVHRAAFKTGDAYVLVWADKAGRARIAAQDARNCCVFYDGETNEIEFGAKVWQGTDRFVYVTLYYPDRIEKYRSNREQANGNVPTTAAAYSQRQPDGEPWPIANPTGVCPLFHFGLEGSILDDVIPLNDALNKEIADLLVSSEANSLRQRWSTGISYEVDPESGKQIIPFERASQWVASSEIGAKFGEFADASLADFLAVVTDFRNEIANVAGIPQYYFHLGTGDFPSGEALRKAESRFAALIGDAQLDFGETWAAVIKFAMQLDGEISTDSVDLIETRWTPAAPMSDDEKVDLAIKKKQIGVSDRQNLSEVGYTESDIKKMQTENAEQKQADASNFKSVFDAGTAIS